MFLGSTVIMFISGHSVFDLNIKKKTEKYAGSEGILAKEGIQQMPSLLN